MGLSFLAPLFLAGLAAVTIPIWIHLSHKTKKEAIQFPSLMFLSRVPYRTVRRQRIRHWLLFLLRSAAIVILVIAFSRPLLNNAAVGGLGLENAREVVVLLDRSFSMGYGDRWERASDAARSVVDRLGPEDHGSLVLFADRAEKVSDPGGEPSVLRAAIDRINVSAGGTRYGPALQLTEQIMTESRLPNREVVLITDFQRSGWDGEEGVTLPQGTVLTRIDVADPNPSNVAVSDLTLDRTYRSGLERVTVLARVTNQSKSPVTDLTLALEIDGDATGSQTVNLEANGSATVRFPEFTLPQREVRGVVRAAEDALPVDNEFRFVLSPGQSISILILEHPNAAADESIYLSGALRIGSEPPHVVDVKRVTQFVPADLDERSVVILNDAPFPRGANGTRLREFLNGGGGLLIVAGPRTGPGSWPAEAADLLPGPIGTPVDRLGDRGGTLCITDYDHPVFDVFSAPRSGDFSQARYFRYRRIGDEGRAAVLARFDDGNIALAEVEVGSGSVLVWASGLSNSWNDLPVQPVFLPMVHQVVRRLADYSPQQPWLIAGQVLDLSQHLGYSSIGTTAGEMTADDVDPVELVVESPTGEREARRVGNNASYVVLDERGFYEVRALAGREDALGSVAVNVDPAESDLTPLDAEELASAVTYRGGRQGGMDLAATLTPVEKERRQGLWWYLLVAVLLILVAETAIANRVSRASTSQ
ncbi:MAG: BatA domain-containing protein [Gemmatimonadales bacterium]